MSGSLPRFTVETPLVNGLGVFPGTVCARGAAAGCGGGHMRQEMGLPAAALLREGASECLDNPGRVPQSLDSSDNT